MLHPLTKKDIKEVFTKSLEPFTKAIQSDFIQVNKRLDKVDSRLDKVEFELKEVRQDVKWMKENSDALFTKLDKFISLYEKQEQELLFLGEQVRRLEERIVKLEIKQF